MIVDNQIPWRCLVPRCFCTGSDAIDTNQLIEASGAAVTVSQDGDTPAVLADKVVLIGGSSEQQKLDACALVVKHLRAMEGRFTGRDLVGDREPAALVILIPRDSAAVIVGAKGAAIKIIMQESGAEINVGREVIFGMADLPVSINGSPVQVLAAVSQINARLQNMFERGNLKNEDFQFRGPNFDVTAEPPRARAEAKARPPVAKSVFGQFSRARGGGSDLANVRRDTFDGESNAHDLAIGAHAAAAAPTAAPAVVSQRSQADVNQPAMASPTTFRHGSEPSNGTGYGDGGAEHFAYGHGGGSAPLPANADAGVLSVAPAAVPKTMQRFY